MGSISRTSVQGVFMFKVTATVREDSCKTNSPISQLVLDQGYGGNSNVFDIERLKALADKGMLYTISHDGYPSARVYIYWNGYFRRWVATTRADYTQCNNLLALPIYYPASQIGTTTHYQSCAI